MKNSIEICPSSKYAPQHIIYHAQKEVWFRGSAMVGMAMPRILANLRENCGLDGDYEAKLTEAGRFNELLKDPTSLYGI